MEPMNPFVLVAKATLAQVAHASEPAMALNEFAVHISHTPPSGPVNPEEQMHAESATDPDGLLEFGPQNVHAADPVSALYRPCLVARRASPSDGPGVSRITHAFCCRGGASRGGRVGRALLACPNMCACGVCIERVYRTKTTGTRAERGFVGPRGAGGAK